MKPLVSLVILLAATAAAMARPALPGGDPFSTAATSTRPHPAVVRVIVPDGTGTSFGSGALVATTDKLGLVVTNWHVVRDARGQIVVAFPDGFRSGATLLDTDRDWDLAALAVWRPNADPIPLATQAPQPGEPLTIAGYGRGDYRAVTGRCTQYVAPGRNLPMEMVELSAGARDGDSGGPILNSRGELAGVLFGAAWGHTTGSYCGRVRWFLTSVADDFQRLDASSTMIARQTQPGATPAAREPQSTPIVMAPPPRPSLNTLTERWRAGGPRSEAGPASNRLPASPGPASNGLPVASIPARPSVSAPSSPGAPRASSPESGWIGSPPPSGATSVLPDPAPAESLRWEDLAGSTRTEQIKTILAGVGLLAIFVHALRLLSKTEAS